MICYFIVRIIRSTFDSAVDFIQFYLTDLLFIPAMATIALIVVRLLKRNPQIVIDARLVFLQTVLISFYFEWYLPTYSSNATWYTSDLWDVAMYFCGAVLFLLLQRRFFQAQK